MAAVNGVRTMEYFELQNIPLHITGILLGISSCPYTFSRQPFLLFSPLSCILSAKIISSYQTIYSQKKHIFFNEEKLLQDDIYDDDHHHHHAYYIKVTLQNFIR
jgi:hypothetical protein